MRLTISGARKDSRSNWAKRLRHRPDCAAASLMLHSGFATMVALAAIASRSSATSLLSALAASPDPVRRPASHPCHGGHAPTVLSAPASLLQVASKRSAESRNIDRRRDASVAHHHAGEQSSADRSPASRHAQTFDCFLRQIDRAGESCCCIGLATEQAADRDRVG